MAKAASVGDLVANCFLAVPAGATANPSLLKKRVCLLLGEELLSSLDANTDMVVN